MSAAEETLALHFRAHGLTPEREHRFHPKRRWRFDFAFPGQMLAVEVEGGLYTNGRHTRGAGYEADLEKYGEAMRMGWSVYRCSPGMVKAGKAIDTILALLKITGEGESCD